jgi:hypothetical protein
MLPRDILKSHIFLFVDTFAHTFADAFANTFADTFADAFAETFADAFADAFAGSLLAGGGLVPLHLYRAGELWRVSTMIHQELCHYTMRTDFQVAVRQG